MKLHLLLPVVLLPATLLGELTRRMGITALVGQIAVGVLLGPALLDILPARESSGAFRELAHVGLCALLFSLGMQSRPEGRASAWKSGALAGIVGGALSFSLGYMLTVSFGWRPQSAAFVGAALIATSISVPVSVLREAGSERSREGSIILAAAFVSDLLGLVGLSVLVSSGSYGSPAYLRVIAIVVQSVAFIAGGFLVGPFLVRHAVRLAGRLASPTVLLVLGFSYLLLVAYGAKAIGLAMVIGAYAAGLAFGGLQERDWLERQFRPLISLLLPLFFVLAGASISFSFLDPMATSGRRLIAFTTALVVMGVLGKIAGPFLLRIDRPGTRVVGYGMVARGGMGFVFAEIGIESGILSPQLFSSVALALTVTTVVGSTGLRIALSNASKANLEPSG